MLPSHPQPGLLSSLIASLWPKSLTHLNLFQTPCPSYNPGFNNPDHICWRPQITQLLTVQFSPSPVTTALSGTNILLSTLFANTFKLWLLGQESFSHPTNKQSCTLMSMLPIMRLEGKWFWILVNDQRDAQIPFYVFIFIFNSLHVSRTSCSSSRETNCVNTSGNCHSVLVAVSCAGWEWVHYQPSY